MCKILIIEDDGDIASIERDYLELNGYQVEIAPDGITGLERGIQGAFDLILLDLMLPRMDGWILGLPQAAGAYGYPHPAGHRPAGGHRQDPGPGPGGGRLH